MNAYELVLVLQKKNIPQDIIKYIIENNNISKESKNYKKLEEILSSNECMKLNPSCLYHYMYTVIFKDNDSLKYMLLKNETIKQCYTDEFINNNKYFTFLSKEQSFVYAILFCMYH
jgi:hypothetical protein